MKIKNIILFLSLVLISCNSYYFNEPQPVDSKNIYKVPKKYTGSWYITDDKKNHQEDFDSLSIGRNFYHRMTINRIKESKNQIDSDTNSYIIDNKFYYKEDGRLKGGFSFETTDDTIIINVVENEIVEFGKTAFLRKIDYGYILNINHEHINDWWEIKFVDTRNKESIIVRQLSGDDLKKSKNYKILHEDFDNYIIAKWSKTEIQDLIEKGGFSDTLLILKYEKKLKK